MITDALTFLSIQPLQTENAQVLAAQQGDREAFNWLVLAYQDRVFNLAYRMLNEETAAEDAAQKVFLNAYQKLCTFRGGSFKNWLLRITANICYDELRHTARHPTVELDPLDEGEGQQPCISYLVDDQPSPEQAVTQAEMRQMIHECLKRLPEEFRTAVVLVDMEDLSYQEVAAMLGIPIGTVKSRLTRGRLRLRADLEQRLKAH